MTRARALKQAIRARADKTGERYTTARRHLLASLKSSPSNEPASRPASPKVAPASTSSKRTGTISEARIAEKTGHGFDHWFRVLDQFDAVKQGHTAAARHLHDAHGVDGWYAQSITVAYERARGARAINQRGDGAYEVSVSKVVTSDVATIIRTITNPRQRAHLTSSDNSLIPALAAALAAPSSKGFVVRADGQGRFRYKWDDTTVQFYLLPKPGGKVSIVVTNMTLRSSEMVEERRVAWREMLKSLAAIV